MSTVRILSIDVGYRNFAFAILEIDKSNDRFIKIVEWDNVDLFLFNSENTELNILGYNLIGKLGTLSKSELIMLCEREQLSDSTIPLEKMKKNALETLLQKKIVEVRKNHSRCACLSNSQDKEKQYALRINICLIKLRKFFDERIDMLKTIDYFVIENQPKKKNAFLGTMQAMIHSYFYFSVLQNCSYQHLINSLALPPIFKSKKVNITKLSSNVQPVVPSCIFRVQLVHAKHKTNLLDEQQLSIDELNQCKKALLNYTQKNTTQKKQAEYNCRKETSKVHCKIILQKFCQDNTTWSTFFESHHKKCDDLSDCFLQGLHFFKMIGVLPSLL